MKTLLSALLIAGSLAAQTAKYPAELATDADLMIARNRVSTTLRASILAGATTITVASATNIVPNMLLTIDSEIVKVTAVNGTSLTVTRGFDGTMAAAHSVGRPVEARIDAWHHNAMAAELKAIQTALGANMVNVPGGGDVNGPASTVDGEMPLWDGTTGNLLKRSALTGVLKSTAGVAAVVTGTASDCVKVDGSSGSCGAGAGDVIGPASAVDSNFAGFDTTTGKLLKDSGSKASDFATAAHNHAATYAPIANGVTNGDTHDHAGGDGAQIAYSGLSGIPATFAPSSHASNHKNGGTDEVASATAGGNLIPKAEAAGTLAVGWIPVLPNTKTTAASANTPSAIVTRDASGNFSAGTITAALAGNASTVTNGVYTNATNTMTGYTDFAGGRMRLPEATFASPPESLVAGQVWLFTDATEPGTCAGVGSSKAQCRWSGSAWVSIGGSPGATGPAGPQGIPGPAGQAGADGAPGAPGYTPNSLTSGGGVVWTSGLSFHVSAATYYIGGVSYTSTASDITLDAADPADDRIDNIVVNTAGAVEVLKGTAASPPYAVPADPATQLSLTPSGIYVAATATTPSDVTTSDIYHENTEWATSRSGTPIVLNSTSNPHAGSMDIEATTAVTGNYMTFVAPAPFNPATTNNLVFWIRSKATWASVRSLQFKWMLSNADKGSIVVLNEGAFGFQTSNTTTYQQIVVPMTLFAANGLSVDRLRITVAGSGTGLGFYLDDIILQSGVAPPVAQAGISQCGVWNASASYPVNCEVIYGNGTWVAVVANTNSTPATGNANWTSSSPLVTNTQTANYVFSGPATGAAAAPTFRALVSSDIPNNAADTSGNAATATNIANNTGTTTTLLHGNAAGAPSFGSVTGSDFAVQNANKVLAGPTTGGDAAPTFRALVTDDIPDLSALYAPASPKTRTFSCTFDGGGSTIAVDSKCYTRIPSAGTITGWSIVAVGTGPTATLDVWKVASGTALPTVSDALTGAGDTHPALASGNAIKSTDLTGWGSTTITADDIAGFNVDAVANATWLQVSIYYTES